jgi:hypothetical protein
MAFPGTLNINYYKGDSYEFNIFPKDSSNAPFNLNGYSVKFSIAAARGSSSIIEGYAVISVDNSRIECAIKPGNGASMTAGTPYFYDVEIKKTSSPYDKVYTVLTGSISVQEQVTLPGGA